MFDERCPVRSWALSAEVPCYIEANDIPATGLLTRFRASRFCFRSLGSAWAFASGGGQRPS